MRLALELAQEAYDIGEVPVGALVVSAQGDILGRGYNRTIIDHDPTAHAEIVALPPPAQLENGCRASASMSRWNPASCASAPCCTRAWRGWCSARMIPRRRLRRVLDVGAVPKLNHHTSVTGGVLAETCGDLLRRFFRERRSKESKA